MVSRAGLPAAWRSDLARRQQRRGADAPEAAACSHRPATAEPDPWAARPNPTELNTSSRRGEIRNLQNEPERSRDALAWTGDTRRRIGSSRA